MDQLGIGGIGFVFGYLLYYAVRHTEKFDVTLLSAAFGAVGSEAVIAWLSPGVEHWLGAYGIGLFAGFMFYLGLTLYLLGKGKFEKPASIGLLFKTLIGTNPENLKQQ